MNECCWVCGLDDCNKEHETNKVYGVDYKTINIKGVDERITVIDGILFPSGDAVRVLYTN